MYFDRRGEGTLIHLENEEKGKLFPEKAVTWTVLRMSKNLPTKERGRVKGQAYVVCTQLMCAET